ncbi:FIG00553991: hypothetical protein [Cronobacter condimenti 1330]|uniref:Uncharacterized protein n=1 Tax=Cronobacter condimenti 1330 TaxID=1073999 RepID=K8A1H7_9ENTR|nr:hypothetical protein [Cronobacter condimenti]ALB64246.1 hypothetical protein AFK62_17810 [Cronobacter condimenti 1330]CCJ73281.1 FIG00553991: hypothetical protein [Cronobacter condimenti 1330]
MRHLFHIVNPLLSSAVFKKGAGNIGPEEFTALLKQSLDDREEFIRTSAAIVAQALIDQAQGKIDAEDIITLLNKQKTIAQIHANSSEIALRTRIQALTVRLLDIAIRSFSGVVK